ncbi:MAG: hypothetical protein ACE362_09805 [Phaeodactylibacter xiamenensis]|uniref:Uncharacterized protein n=1 Tax=Phaeodactylibacter xiamenensis TaxID=1524460 RepID=A0A098S6Q0_9BACT|nr:hypothetical protein [Phaeodactylibacter xiamenensis]KGE88199.1 hypothetical protein IX84_10300 [Phaeodactylibacter xiamenensis]MCR9051854.1 hypothetical protein [bacterium]
MEFQKLSPLELRDLINKFNSDLRKLQYQVVKTQAMVSELEGYLSEAETALGLEISTATVNVPEVEAAPKKEKEEKAAAPKTKGRGRPKGAKNKKTTEKKDAKPAATSKTKGKGKGPGRPPGSKSKKKATTETQPKAAKEKASQTAKETPANEHVPGYRLSEWDDFVLKSIKDKGKVLTTSELTKIGVANPEIKLGAAQIKTKLNASLHKLANKKGLLAKVEHSGRGFAYALQEWVSASGELPKNYVEE